MKTKNISIDLSFNYRHLNNTTFIKDIKHLNNTLDKLIVIALTIIFIVLAPSAKKYLDNWVTVYTYSNYSLDTVNKEAVSVLPKNTVYSRANIEVPEYLSLIPLDTTNTTQKVEDYQYMYQAYKDRHSVESTPEIPEWFEYKLAQLIQAEGGILNDEAQQLIGYVFLNRMRSSYFPDSFDGVFNDGDSYNIKTHYFLDNGNAPSEQALENSKTCLNNYYTNTIPVPDCLIYQSEFLQGAGSYRHIENMFFCLDDRSNYNDDYKNYLNN